MIDKPVRIEVLPPADERTYNVCLLPPYHPLRVKFSHSDFCEALPKNLRIVLSAHDTLAYDTSWMGDLYIKFYVDECDLARADFWRRASVLSEWVTATFDGVFDKYLFNAISVQLIASVNDELAAHFLEMERAGHTTYQLAVRHIFGVQQCLST